MDGMVETLEAHKSLKPTQFYCYCRQKYGDEQKIIWFLAKSGR